MKTTPSPKITVLCGGLGGARLASALHAAGLDGRTTFVANVADDLEVDGLRVCPDTDAVVYALAGCFDEERGWGIRGDVFGSSNDGTQAWFRIGRRDRQHHLRRTELLDAGMTLGAATAVQTSELGVAASVVPATDDPLRTRILADAGALGFQEWLVRDHAEPLPRSIVYDGVGSARPADAALRSIATADLVVIAASSPVASILPILALPRIREAIRGRSGPTVAISPVALRREPRTDRDRRRARVRAALLASIGVPHDPAGVAGLYRDLATAFVLDPSDERDAAAISSMGFEVLLAPTTSMGTAERRALVDVLMKAAGRDHALPHAHAGT